MIIRKAKTSDKNIVLEFCNNTFSWGDYIEDVWDYWKLEGNLLILTQKNTPVAICHSSFFDSQVWIEGIRVNEKFRKKGFAKNLVLRSEKLAKNKKCTTSQMLIATNNKKSLNLAKKLSYKKESIWNFYSVIPSKSIKKSNISIANKIIIDFLLSNLSSYVKSWRWIPLTKSNINKLIKQKRILYTKHNDEIDSLVIYTESEHFEKTLMLTLVSGTKKGTKEIIEYFQNYAIKNNLKRIQILTKAKTLPKMKDLEKRFSFCLMKKEL